MARIGFYIGLLAALKGVVPQTSTTLLPQLYKRFPVGQVKPTGWALNQGRVQAEGLAGHLRDWYSFVANSIWVPGGTQEYSEMHEAAPYWFNGMVALGFQIGDERLIKQAKDFVNHLITNQQADGWIGPELPTNGTVPRLPWPRYLILMGLIQYAEAVDAAESDRVITSIHKFTDLMYTTWKNGQQGSPSLGFQFAYQQVRWEELVYSLQWLYDNAPRGKQAQLIETMKLLKADGYDWQHNFFAEAVFPKTAVTGSGVTMFSHGVNVGEAIKSEALSYRFTGDSEDIKNTYDRLSLLYTYHGRASGTYSADEHLAGLNPSRGTETCAVVEQMFSLETIYQSFGNSSIADIVEKLAYNAMPAASLADMWSHQYDQQANQIWAKNFTDGVRPWGDNGPYSGVFGMESNYPCCTVNHPQGSPKLWAHTFFKNHAETTVVHALLGPSTLSTTLTGGNVVKIAVDTIYPFGSTLKYTVDASKPFNFNIRIPGYALNNRASTISVNGRRAIPITPNSDSLQVVPIATGRTTINVTLAMPLQIETRSNGAVAINRGPLNYAVQLGFSTSTTAGWRNPQSMNDAKRLFPATPPVPWFEEFDNHTKDYTLLPTVDWRIAIDPSTITVKDNSGSTTRIPKLAWNPGAQPVTMTAKGCQIQWQIVKNAADAPPVNPVCQGSAFEVKLTAFGATPLRIGEIPVVKLA